MWHIYNIKLGMLEMRENEISLRKWSSGTAQLRTVEGTVPARVFSIAENIAKARLRIINVVPEFSS